MTAQIDRIKDEAERDDLAEAMAHELGITDAATLDCLRDIAAEAIGDVDRLQPFFKRPLAGAARTASATRLLREYWSVYTNISSEG